MGWKILLCDADNTLFDFSRGEKAAISQTLPLFSIVPTEENLALYERLNREQWQALERGETTQSRLRTDRFRNLLRILGLPEENCDAMNLEYSTRLGQQRFLLPGALNFCRRVSAAMPVWLVTNGISGIQRSRFNSSELSPYLAGLVISEEVGAAKPDPAILFRALELAHFQKEDAILLGDSLTADIAAANRAGIPSVWFTGGKEPDPGHPATWAVKTLEEAADLILFSKNVDGTA